MDQMRDIIRTDKNKYTPHGPIILGVFSHELPALQLALLHGYIQHLFIVVDFLVSVQALYLEEGWEISPW
jgi:hypothetical protein